MRPGGGKQKGSAFERWVCKQLSLWVTDGQRQDVFWRSAMSGGRATVAQWKGWTIRQAGDITAVEAEGIEFCRKWYVECKHVKHLGLDTFFVKQSGTLYKFWEKTVKESAKHGRDPMLIVKQNGWPVLVVSRLNHVAHWITPIVTNQYVDVTDLDRMLRSPYDNTRNGRPPPYGKSKRQLPPRLHDKDATRAAEAVHRKAARRARRPN